MKTAEAWYQQGLRELELSRGADSPSPRRSRSVTRRPNANGRCS
jgi:hypothetical protein